MAHQLNVPHVEVSEWFVDEHEAARRFLILEQADQQDERLDDLLSARGLSVVQTDLALAVEVEVDFEFGLAEYGVVIV